MTTTEHLNGLLQSTLGGELALEEFLAAFSTAAATEPAATTQFMRDVEALYTRNEIRYDVYFVLKDRLAAIAKTTTARVPGVELTPAPVSRQATVAPSATPPEGATQLRPAARPASSNQAVAPDRTILRSPTPAEGATVFRGSTGPVQAASSATAPRGARVTGTPASGRVTGSTGPGTAWEEGSATLTTEQPLEPGSLINNRFMLVERVGAGGMGVVFKARDLRKEEAQDRDPFVAIKFLNPEFRRHPESLKALQRETRRAQSLAHPNVVTVYDFDRDGTLIYMTMEYLDGESLDRFIQRHPQGLKFSEAWPIIEGAGRALMYSHEEGVIHADFKPGNVFIAEKKAKVLDFGIARAMKAQTDAKDGTQFDAGDLGALTPAYASPEMFLDQEPDPRDDVYALAVVAYELMTGRHPFNGASAMKASLEGMKVKRADGMGRYQYKAVVHGLAFKQSDRTPSVEAFLDEIAGPFGRRGRAIRQAIVSMASTAIFVSVVGAALWWFTRPDPDKQLERRLFETAAAEVAQAKAGGTEIAELDAELRDVLLEQGNDYLAMGREQFDPGVLSEGVSNAYGAYTEVLRMDPSNKAAVAGIVEIVRLYEVEMQRLAAAAEHARVVELAGYARKLDPNRATFEDLEREARSHVTTAPAPAE
jgi:predicted Ser/Thr protein kinase